MSYSYSYQILVGFKFKKSDLDKKFIHPSKIDNEESLSLIEEILSCRASFTGPELQEIILHPEMPSPCDKEEDFTYSISHGGSYQFRDIVKLSTRLDQLKIILEDQGLAPGEAKIHLAASYI
jgi:hypothetical protein